MTAQPEAGLSEEVPHHLFGFLPIEETCDAARYLVLAEEVAAEISGRGKTPIFCGGTGFYIKAYTHGIDPIPSPDPALRAELSSLSLDALQSRLREADPQAFDAIDRNNPRRVLRAIEIVLQTGMPLEKSRSAWNGRPPRRHTGIYLWREREELHARIRNNVEILLAGGAIDEVRSALKTGIGETAGKAIGFREITSFLEGKIDEGECQAKILSATLRYAKRQQTWFKAQKNFVPLLLGETVRVSEAVPQIAANLNP